MGGEAAVLSTGTSQGSGLRLSGAVRVRGEREIEAREERWLRGGSGGTSFNFEDRVEFSWREELEYTAAGALAWKGNPQLARPALPMPQPRPQSPRLAAPPPQIRRPEPARTSQGDAGAESEHIGTSREELARLIFKELFGIDAGERLDAGAFSAAQERAQAAAQEIQGAYSGRGTLNDRWLDAGVRQEVKVQEQVELDAELAVRSTAADGSVTEQRVAVKLRISRELVQNTEQSIQIGRKKDPLVLDLTGSGISLTGIENGMVFDLDADGEADRMATVSGGTALLWLDRNGNGQLDSGRELFGDFDGAADGFAALAELDTNRDGVVDANDERFGAMRLRIYDQGQARDQSLAQAGVSALELAHLKFAADLGASASLDALGVFRRTDGTAGLLADAQLGYQKASAT